MNTYLVPVTKEYQSKFVDIMVIYANTMEEAYLNAKSKKGLVPITIQKYDDVPYDFYIGELYFPETFFSISRKRDILNKVLSCSKEDKYLETVDIYDYMQWGDYNSQIQKLAEKALPEKWSFEGKDDNYILKNYLRYTFKNFKKRTR